MYTKFTILRNQQTMWVSLQKGIENTVGVPFYRVADKCFGVSIVTAWLDSGLTAHSSLYYIDCKECICGKIIGKACLTHDFFIVFHAVLWNRNYLLRFRFRFWLLKSFGSGFNFWKVMVPVPVPTFEKVPVSVPTPYLDHKKQICQKNVDNFIWLFT